jgi:hypothetical protein
VLKTLTRRGTSKTTTRRRVALTAAGAVALAAATVVATGEPALADPAQTFQNQMYGAYLNTGFSGGLYFPNLSWRSTSWYVHVWNDHTVRLKNLYNLKCIYSTDSEVWMPDTCDSSRNESWYVTRWNDGTIRFQNQETGLCMRGTSDYGVEMAPCDSSMEESWW